jgi:uncharacterized membrane protein
MAGATHWFARIATRRIWVVRINILLLLAWFAVALGLLPRLPDRLPIHFTLDGSPTRWEPATALSWLLLPALAAALSAFMRLMERLQAWLERPYAARAAPAAGSAAQQRLRRTYGDLCATLLILALAFLHLGVWLVAAGHGPVLPTSIRLAVALALGGVLALIIPLQRAGELDSSDRG